MESTNDEVNNQLNKLNWPILRPIPMWNDKFYTLF